MKTPGRQSIGLKGYDYTQPGAYFVTVCVQNRLCLFADVVGDHMVLNDTGLMVEKIWKSLPVFNVGVTLDEFIVMPNHFHGIIVLDGQMRDPIPAISFTDVMQRFKSITTALYWQGVKNGQWPEIEKRLRQRNYYERIISNERHIDRVRKYIQGNPANWSTDPENPSQPMP